MTKSTIRTRTLAPAVVLAVGALFAAPVIATSAHAADASPTASEGPTSHAADAAAAPTVSFPDHPDSEVDRSAGESISIKVGYEGVETGASITVYVNGEKVEHGAGYEAITQTDRQSGAFWMRLDGAFLDSTQSGVDAARDTVQVRVGEARSAIQVNEISEDPADISPSVEMDHPLQAADVARDGIEVRVKTAPDAEVDVSKVSVMFDAGYTLSPEGDWNGTADENGEYTFTISPDTEITSTFSPDRSTTVGQLQNGDGVVVQIRSNGKSTSFATEVEGEAEQPAEPTVEFPDHPGNTAERTIGEDFTTTVAHTGATEGDEIRVIVNGYTQTHGEGTYEAPATVTEADGEFQISLPAAFLDDVRSGTAADQDVLQVRVGTTRNHIRITEVEPDGGPQGPPDHAQDNGPDRGPDGRPEHAQDRGPDRGPDGRPEHVQDKGPARGDDGRPTHARSTGSGR